MKMDKVAGSGNDEFFTPKFAIKPLLKYIKPRSVIWCPFDTHESNYVKIFSENGHEVINGHIDDGEDFFAINPFEDIRFDYIISNPPYSCLLPDHDVLTINGWKNITDVSIGDMVMSVNYNTMELSWDKVVNTVHKYVSEDVYDFNSKHFSQTVTADHRMFCFSRFTNNIVVKNNDLITASDTKESYYFPKNGYKWDNESEEFYEIPGTFVSNGHKEIWKEPIKIRFVDWARFFGLWLADGCTRNTLNSKGNPRYTVSIKQGVHGYDKIREILSKLPFTVKEYHNKNNTCNFEIHNKQLWEHLHQFGTSYTKYVPFCIKNGSKLILISFFDGYAFGDSHNGGNKNLTIYSTVSKQLSLDIQEILLKLGYLVNIFEEKIKNGTLYKMCASTNNKWNRIMYGKPNLIKYEGFVHCITLAHNSVFLIRHHNKISFTGNCKTEVLQRLFEINIPFAMLVGVVGLFESQRRFDMFKNNKFEIMYFNKRVSYMKDYSSNKLELNPPFSSVYVCHNILPQQIVFEEINKKDI